MDGQMQNSLEMYGSMRSVCGQEGRRVTEEDVSCLLEQAAEELLIFGCSPLLSAAHARCCCGAGTDEPLYVPRAYRLSPQPCREEVAGLPLFDMRMLIGALSQRISGQEGRDFLLNWVKGFGASADSVPFCARPVVQELTTMDEAVVRIRREMFRRLSESPGAAVSGPEQEAGTGEKARDIPAQARQETDAIPAETEQGKAELPEQTEEAAARRTAETEAAPERVDWGGEMAELRRSLLQVNEGMRKLEDTFAGVQADRVIRQFLELYNLLADMQESLEKRIQAGGALKAEDMLGNLGVLMDMTVDALSDQGVEPVETAPGERFYARCQEVEQGVTGYDPRTAIIERSLRTGFVRGEQILQKERVALQRAE